MFPSSGSYYKKLLTYQNQLFYLRTYSFSFWLIINFITEAKCFLPAVVIIKNSRHIKFNCFKSYRRTMNLLATIRLSNTGVYLQMYHLVLEFYYCAWFAKKKKKIHNFSKSFWASICQRAEWVKRFTRATFRSH